MHRQSTAVHACRLRSLQQQGYVAAELQDQLGGMVQRMGERCEDLVMDLVEAAARTQQMLLSAESLENVSGGACLHAQAVVCRWS